MVVTIKINFWQKPDLDSQKVKMDSWKSQLEPKSTYFEPFFTILGQSLWTLHCNDGLALYLDCSTGIYTQYDGFWKVKKN